jgi:CheY-like chemotaxis protein
VSGVSGIKDLINHLESGTEKKKILIVDDDPSYIGLIRSWLKDDYKVFMSTSGEMALDWLSKNNADLILLDYEMPDLSGPQMLSKIITGESTKDTPVVYITGNERSEIENCINADVSGAKPDGCIYKTVTRDEMLEAIKSYIR